MHDLVMEQFVEKCGSCGGELGEAPVYSATADNLKAHVVCPGDPRAAHPSELWRAAEQVAYPDMRSTVFVSLMVQHGHMRKVTKGEFPCGTMPPPLPCG